MERIQKEAFEMTRDGRATTIYTMTNQQGATVSICNYGGIVTALKVPDKDGKLVDVALGYEHLAGYEEATTFFGALIGRYANRIGKGQFTLNDVSYQLACNDGENHLHGGAIGFDSRIWEVEELENGLRLSLNSPDMEEQYPGNLDVAVTYTFDDDNCLTITYDAVSDQDTICNLTNHLYFNLDGHAVGNVEGQMMKIYASAFTPTDAGSIPTGEIRSVADTPFDFREYKRIGQDIEAPCEQLELAGGYDHNYVLDKPAKTLSVAAEAYSPTTGIALRCETTQPAIQFYTGNYVTEQPMAKEQAGYHKRQGFCLETQGYPDAINHENFPSVVLKAGEQYHEVTKYQFAVHATDE